MVIVSPCISTLGHNSKILFYVGYVCYCCRYCHKHFQESVYHWIRNNKLEIVGNSVVNTTAVWYYTMAAMMNHYYHTDDAHCCVHELKVTVSTFNKHWWQFFFCVLTSNLTIWFTQSLHITEQVLIPIMNFCISTGYSDKCKYSLVEFWSDL
jgi:hypothetical protein